MRPCAAIADGSPPLACRRALLIALFGLALLPTTARGDALRILNDDQEAAQARVDLIQSAEVEIDVAYFGINDDNLALAFLALLRDASRRGVKVRIVVDGLRNEIPGAVQQHLQEEGVEIREYHPIQAMRPLWLNRRLHDKILVADASQLIVGSRNFSRSHFGLACRRYVDCDAYVRGCAAQQAHDYFQCLWVCDELRPAKPGKCHCLLKTCVGSVCSYCSKREEDSIHPGLLLDRALIELVQSGFIQTDVSVDWTAGRPHTSKAHFLFDANGRKKQPGAISDRILEVFATAQESIVIESPYLLISRTFDAALAEAQARGVQVIILTNSLASTDQMLVYACYSNQRSRLLARGVEIWEFAGPEHFHAKSALVDGCISIIGSYNFDPRSEYLNTETAVMSCDPCVADALIGSMAEHFACAWRIGPDGKPLGADCKHPGAGWGRIMKLRCDRLVAPLIKRHL